MKYIPNFKNRIENIKNKYSYFDLKKLFNLIRINLNAFVVCQLIMMYSFIFLDIGRGLVVTLVKNFMGVEILVQDNFLDLLKHPTSVILLVIYFLFQLFFVLIGIIGNYRIYAASIRGEKIGAYKLIKEIAITYVKLFSFKRIAIIPIVVFTMLFSFITLYTSSASGFRVPEFITDWIGERKVQMVMLNIFRVIMTYIWFRVLFVITGMLLENKTFSEARKQSSNLFKLNRNNYIKFIILSILFINIVKSGIYFLSMLFSYIFSIIQNANIVENLYRMNWRSLFYIQMLTDVLQVGILVVGYTSFYKIPIEPRKQITSKSGVIKKGVIVIICIFLIEVYNINVNSNRLLMDLESEPKIVAHRAGSAFGPENSLSALEVSVISEVTSMVEIDVQLTKDGEVILNHDPTLKRVTGNPNKASDLTLKEIKDLGRKGRGGFFEEDGIPTLNEFLDKIGKLEVMIELKSEPELIEELLDKVFSIAKEKNLLDKIVIASMNRANLDLSKEKEPTVRTALISAILLGADFDEDYIDIFSIELSGLSSELVGSAHSKDKKVFVWTINTARGVKKALRSSPDGIVTDNVFYVHYSYYNEDDSIPFQNDILRYFMSKSNFYKNKEMDSYY